MLSPVEIEERAAALTIDDLMVLQGIEDFHQVGSAAGSLLECFPDLEEPELKDRAVVSVLKLLNDGFISVFWLALTRKETQEIAKDAVPELLRMESIWRFRSLSYRHVAFGITDLGRLAFEAAGRFRINDAEWLAKGWIQPSLTP